VTPDDVGDRLAIADLVNAYAQRVDNRDPAGVAALFTDDGVLTIRAKVGEATPTGVRRGREEIAQAIAAMDYRVTCHMVGNHLAVIDGDQATAETRGIAHHVVGPPGDDVDRVWYLRYLDTYRRTPDGWRIATRDLWLDFSANGRLSSL